MAIRIAILSVLITALLSTGAFCINTPELYRIRISNAKGGLVQVSLDGGKSYSAVGRVTAPANARIIGFSASSYMESGTVAATAVHGIRIKTGQSAKEGYGKKQIPLMFSISPRQFSSSMPSGYGGHNPRSAGIDTDIPAGEAIFRNFAPFAGSKVLIERNFHTVQLPQDYIPQIGDVFVIVVNAPTDAPESVVFDNKAGGSVIAYYSDDRTEVLANVVRPVLGVGRYDGTTFTGVGSINTNHGGVITISTAQVCPANTIEGSEPETRGGFMIQPYFHVQDQGETKPQVMVIGPKDKTKPSMEGTPPLFHGTINLWRFANKPERSYRVQFRIDDGDWRDVPELVGRIDNAFSAEYLKKRLGNSSINKGVTGIRLLFPKFEREAFQQELKQLTEACAKNAIKVGAKPLRGQVAIEPGKADSGATIVNYYIDGNFAYASNSYPYTFQWDTHKTPNGLHSLQIETVKGQNSKIEKRTVLVQN